jgi:hypothetical protein
LTRAHPAAIILESSWRVAVHEELSGPVTPTKFNRTAGVFALAAMFGVSVAVHVAHPWYHRHCAGLADRCHARSHNHDETHGRAIAGAAVALAARGDEHSRLTGACDCHICALLKRHSTQWRGNFPLRIGVLVALGPEGPQPVSCPDSRLLLTRGPRGPPLSSPPITSGCGT